MGGLEMEMEMEMEGEVAAIGFWIRRFGGEAAGLGFDSRSDLETGLGEREIRREKVWRFLFLDCFGEDLGKFKVFRTEAGRLGGEGRRERAGAGQRERGARDSCF
jgi:hypothetical protein